jgi:Aerotolerance regulator N-terminal
MTWLAPGAFAALVLLAGPVIVHMLARRNARRLVFPATHLVKATQAAAIKLRQPSDLGLLLLRLAIVAAAVLAAAQPLVMTPWRLARWNARATRAVVVDTSRSVPDPGVAARLADQQMRNVFAAHRFDAPDLADGIDRAVRWLRAASPSRREIVIVSDFQRGSIDDATVKQVPAEVGVRVVRAGVLPATRRVTLPSVAGWRGGVWQATATIDAAGSRVSWVRGGTAPALPWISVTAAPADAAAADRALRAATSPGVSAGDASRRIIVRFAGAPPIAPPTQPVTREWIASAALSDAIRGVEPAVTVSERDGVMVVDAPIAASAFEAPAIVRAAILAVRPAAIADAEAEVATLTDEDLARWRREAAPVTTSAIPLDGESDARWLWAIALMLLAVEAWLRRVPRHTAEQEAHADAA